MQKKLFICNIGRLRRPIYSVLRAIMIGSPIETQMPVTREGLFDDRIVV